MEIVIKIPEEMYTYLRNGGNLGASLLIEKAIKNGTPLPEGHGRMIDADALGEKLHRYTDAPYQYALTVFNDAPTIIEADKESEDE